MLTNPICLACGTLFPDETGGDECPICLDERQFVPEQGQRWIELHSLQRTHRVDWKWVEPMAYTLSVSPHFGIGQRAMLIKSSTGNILWDCLGLIDTETIARAGVIGDIDAIAISHPHFYGAHREWSDTFGGIPVYIHEDDRDWVMCPHDSIVYWSGDTFRLAADLTLIRCGGHFAGASVLHWAHGGGIVFSGDVLQVAADRKHVSFMRSYPNLIPLNANSVRRIGAALAPFRFSRIHAAFAGRSILEHAKKALEVSIERYVQALGQDPD